MHIYDPLVLSYGRLKISCPLFFPILHLSHTITFPSDLLTLSNLISSTLDRSSLSLVIRAHHIFSDFKITLTPLTMAEISEKKKKKKKAYREDRSARGDDIEYQVILLFERQDKKTLELGNERKIQRY